MNNNEGLTIALVFRRSRISVLKLRNLKDITMPHSHFRLKVNLSKFYQDARRICWILIDLTKIQHIIHVKQHISKIFGIREPFHLLLNDAEYLPPMEDVRVLLENETIKVVPGSGINNEVVLTTSAIISNSDNDKQFSKVEKCNDINTLDNKIVQAANVKVDKARVNTTDWFDLSNGTLNNTDPSVIYNNNNTLDMMFTTAIEDTEADTNSKITDYSNVTENYNTMDSTLKRKRTRKRKSKSQNNEINNKLDSQLDTLTTGTKEGNDLKKPKIVDSVIIPAGKHIRFNDMEDEENHDVKQIVHEVPRDVLTHSNIMSAEKRNEQSTKSFSALFALRGSSTPIFPKQIKGDKKMENLPTPIISAINEVDMESPIEKKATCSKNSSKTKNDNSLEMSVCTKERNKRKHISKNVLKLDLENLPVMTRTPRTGDIIGFKTLKLAENYTPQVSDFIIGEVLSFCADSVKCSFKIISGLEEIENMPSGKFSLEGEEDEFIRKDDKVSFSFSQIREPRLISL